MTLVRVVLEKCLCVEKQETETLDVLLASTKH